MAVAADRQAAPAVRRRRRVRRPGAACGVLRANVVTGLVGADATPDADGGVADGADIVVEESVEHDAVDRRSTIRSSPGFGPPSPPTRPSRCARFVGRTSPGCRAGSSKSVRASGPTSRSTRTPVDAGCRGRTRAAAGRAGPRRGRRRSRAGRGERTGPWRVSRPTEPFDAVVCSLVLCSVDDPDSVLRQLFSSLRPGGELRYLEHVASDGTSGPVPAVRRCTTIWPRLAGNCHTHRAHREVDPRRGIRGRRRPDRADVAGVGADAGVGVRAGRASARAPAPKFSSAGSRCSSVGSAVLADFRAR